MFAFISSSTCEVGPTPPYTMLTPILAKQFCQLQTLGSEHKEQGHGTPQPVLGAPISTPLVTNQWKRAVEAHPDRQWTQCLIAGIQEGFRIGLVSEPECGSSRGNSRSSQIKGDVICEFIKAQTREGHISGPLHPQECPNVITSHMAVIPKKTPRKWRVIVDLSSPKGKSVNDNLHRELTHVSYSSPDDGALLMHFLDKRSLLAKIDLREAYRMVSIHPKDRRFLGISWQNSVYIDCQLPFSLASVPAIFNALAKALEWILRSRGVRYIIHYLDDFLRLGPPDSIECRRALDITLKVCKELGVPIAEDKLEGPVTQLTFLGIELNSINMSLKLPEDKMVALRSLLDTWRRTKCIRDVHQLQSLLGYLVHACHVLPLGKAFLNNLFPLSNTMQPGQKRRLNCAARCDLAWWSIMCSHWSGISVHPFLLLQDQSTIYLQMHRGHGVAGPGLYLTGSSGNGQRVEHSICTLSR